MNSGTSTLDSASGDELDTTVGDSTLSGRGRRRGGARLEAGERVGRYVIEGVLGVGGMGVVYAAYDPELERRVALKLMLPDDSIDPDSAQVRRRRLLREAQAMARLMHPNVITVHDVGTHEGQVFVAMELIEGKTLSGWLDGTRSRREILDVFVRAGEGLAAAHEAGIIHRDFKPDNVMLGDAGQLRVMDFGLARPSETEPEPAAGTTADASTVDMTQTGRLMGTPAYMAPEQHSGRGATAASDQFAFCTSLYEALYGERPFAGDNLMSLSFEVLEGNVRPPPKNTDVPSWLRGVLLRGLSVDPSRRFADMHELLTALKRDPTRRRRRIIIGSSAGIAAIGLAVTSWAIGTRSDFGCRGASDGLERVWNTTRRSEIRRAIFADGAAYAKPAWTEVQRTVDEYAERWSSQAVEACEANRRGQQSDRMLDLRMHCLDERLTALDEVLSVFSEAREDLAAHAVAITGSLPSLEACTDLETLRLEVAPPGDPMVAKAAEDLRSRMEHVRALEMAGESQPALQEARALLEDAMKTSYPPVQAEAKLVVGSLLARTGAPREGAAHLEESFWLASAERHDRVAADAAAELVLIEGRLLGRADRAAAWKLQARTSVARLGEGGRQQQAHLLVSLGMVSEAADDLEGAYSSLDQALALHRELWGEQHPRTLEVVRKLGGLRMSQERYEEARRLLETAYRAFAHTHGQSHPRTAAVVADLGRVALRKREWDAAEAHLRRAMAALDADEEPALRTRVEADLAALERARTP